MTCRACRLSRPGRMLAARWLWDPPSVTPSPSRGCVRLGDARCPSGPGGTALGDSSPVPHLPAPFCPSCVGCGGGGMGLCAPHVPHTRGSDGKKGDVGVWGDVLCVVFFFFWWRLPAVLHVPVWAWGWLAGLMCGQAGAGGGGNGADGAMLGVPAAAGLPVTFCLQLFRRSFLEPCHRLGPQPARRVPGLRRAAGGAGQGAGTGGGRRGQSRGTRHCHWLGTAHDFHRHLSNRDLLQHFTFLRRSARPRAKRSLL